MAGSTTTTEHPDRAARLAISREKYVAPFDVDPTMRFYSPQENVDGLAHPRVAEWLRFITEEYEPDLPSGEPVLLLIPCTRTKPYSMSLEHRRINGALADAGFTSTRQAKAPAGFPDPSPLVRGTGPRRIVVHRMVISEPMGVVPYELMYQWRGEQAPASSYDDPGLFEERGTSVSPWHPRHSAEEDPRHPGRWRWGPNEKADYAVMHNAMSAAITSVLDRIGGRYVRRIAWVAPGLTHRSFLSSYSQKRAEHLPASRQAHGERLDLVGVNDHCRHQVDVRPTADELATAVRRRIAHPFLEPAALDLMVHAVTD
jgi:hypothetical protein